MIFFYFFVLYYRLLVCIVQINGDMLFDDPRFNDQVMVMIMITDN